MSRLQKLLFILSRNEGKYFFFFLGIFLLSWPFIIYLNEEPQSYPFYFYFLVWGLVLLILIGISLVDDIDEDDQKK